MRILFFYSGLFFSILSSCSTSGTPPEYTQQTVENWLSIPLDTAKIKLPCKWDYVLTKAGLVDIQSVDSTIKVDIKYATSDNFMHQNLYGCLNHCYVQPDVAEKLIKAQRLLKAENPNLSLLIYDGVRPRSVQQKMWDALDMPIYEKSRFVSNPQRGSLHNFGAAVDITLWNTEKDSILDMGTPYDYIGIKAWPIKEQQLLKNGVLTPTQIENRKLLRKVMTQAGFFNIQSEWWHFNSCHRNEAYEKYKIIE